MKSCSSMAADDWGAIPAIAHGELTLWRSLLPYGHSYKALMLQHSITTEIRAKINSHKLWMVTCLRPSSTPCCEIFPAAFVFSLHSEWVSSVLRPHQHSIGYLGDGFYRSKDPTNSIKVLNMLQKRKKTTKTTKYTYTQRIIYTQKDIHKISTTSP